VDTQAYSESECFLLIIFSIVIINKETFSTLKQSEVVMQTFFKYPNRKFANSRAYSAIANPQIAKVC
jgi:hypothetical protein